MSQKQQQYIRARSWVSHMFCSLCNEFKDFLYCEETALPWLIFCDYVMARDFCCHYHYQAVPRLSHHYGLALSDTKPICFNFY